MVNNIGCEPCNTVSIPMLIILGDADPSQFNKHNSLFAG